jgi:hypothetical protein
LTVAIAGAFIFASGAGHTEITETTAKSIVEGYPLGTMTQWLQSESTSYALNPVNIRAGKHPDREDPNNGPYDVIYIFPTEALANAWWDPVADPQGMPDEIPDDAVAFVHWELDNQSGTFPGIMSYRDVDGFKSRNCIMAAGDTIPVPGPENPAIKKTCNNPQGASKRFKMNILKADTPIDLVYTVEQADLTYTNYDDLPSVDITADGVDNPVEESGRIYRVLQKFHNATSTDTANGVDNPGTRIAGFSVQLGTGVGDVVGDPNRFVAINGNNADALLPDKELGFELRPCMSDHFFDVKRDRPGTGVNPCSDSFDGDGDPDVDQALPQEIWLEEEYSTFSPKMFSFKDDKRMIQIGIPGGFWDKKPGGIYPPEIQTLGLLDSGDAASDAGVYWDNRIDTQTSLAGYIGATTPNYFDIVAKQASGVVDGDGIDAPSPFGYLMYYGVLADDDIGNLAQGVYVDEDGDPATEGDLLAWWDGSEYRRSSDPDLNGEIDANAFEVVPTETLVEWALNPLVEDCGDDCPPPPLYEIGIMDDLAGLNVDYFVYLGRKFTGDQFTIRLTATSVATAGAAGGYGDQTPAWVTNPAPDLESFVSDDGVITINAEGFAGDPLLISLADTGATGAGSLPSVEVENLRSEETETITLLQDSTLNWKFTYTLPTAADAVAGANDDGTLNVWPNDVVRVTYVDAFDGTDTDVVKTDEVTIPIETIDPTPPPSGGGDDDSGWCSYNPNGRFDPVLPALILTALGYLGLRRRITSGK